MQTRIHENLAGDPLVAEADDILRACVHCGFCTAVCPTYQILGDEADGPRGRIYLIKNFLEEDAIDASAVAHLDRCLTCRSCETTCPSGVQYGRLLDIARGFTEQRITRSVRERLLSVGLRITVPNVAVISLLYCLGRLLRPLLPRVLRSKIPGLAVSAPLATETAQATEEVVVLEGCAQRAATPGVNRDLEKLLAIHGVAVRRVAAEGCCGALDYHLSAQDKGLARMRRMCDALWPAVEAGVTSIVSTASGCGVMVKEYGDLLANDPDYADRARRISELCVDGTELLERFSFTCEPARVAVHSPCTLQHGQKLPDALPALLTNAGMTLTATRDSHLCCGSAGTYSIMQPALSAELATRKVHALTGDDPDVIVTANVGCHIQLSGIAETPVMHYATFIASRLRG